MVQNDLDETSVVEQADQLSFPTSVSDFLRGSLGQPHGGFPEPFRSLVLGDSTADRWTPWRQSRTPRLRGAAHPARRPSMAVQCERSTWCRRRSTQRSSMSTSKPPKNTAISPCFPLPSSLVAWKKGEEAAIEIEQGKTLIVKFETIGQPNDDGEVPVFFELNGQPRTIFVRDRSLESESEQREKADKSRPGCVGAPLSGVVTEVRVNPGGRSGSAFASGGDVGDEDGNRGGGAGGGAWCSGWWWIPNASLASRRLDLRDRAPRRRRRELAATSRSVCTSSIIGPTVERSKRCEPRNDSRSPRPSSLHISWERKRCGSSEFATEVRVRRQCFRSGASRSVRSFFEERGRDLLRLVRQASTQPPRRGDLLHRQCRSSVSNGSVRYSHSCCSPWHPSPWTVGEPDPCHRGNSTPRRFRHLLSRRELSLRSQTWGCRAHRPPHAPTGRQRWRRRRPIRWQRGCYTQCSAPGTQRAAASPG